MHHGAAQSQRQRQRPPVLVLRYCPRPPRRHLAARNTKGTGARPQPRTTPPPRPAPAPCPARLALLLSFAPSPPRASARAPSCDAPVPCQCPALRRCGHARPAVTCNSAKQRARESPRPTPRQSPRPPPRHRHATTRRPTPAPGRPVPVSTLRRCGIARPVVTCNRANAPPCAAAASPVPSSTCNRAKRVARSDNQAENARKQGLRWYKKVNVLPEAKQGKASTAARIPRSQVFPGGRGRYEQTGRLLRGTWTCGRAPAARGSEMMSLGSKLG